ncbi:BTAD domain-containing putative transcriptional regulator [Tateyamaria sp. SN3-11]|uniref:BTAD domain-containing putative transcriptional regulator n=1 Tax=Tateyamaria sp. SN3-11 TaxID=3092147 RepID=UPI0039ED2EC7
MSLLDQLDVHVDDQRIHIPKAKAKAVLALIATSPSLRTTREVLRGTLWPNSDEAAAQTSLRNALWALNRAFETAGFAGLKADRRDVWLEPGVFSNDLDMLLSRCKSGKLPKSLTSNPKAIENTLSDLVGLSDLMDQRIHDHSEMVRKSIRLELYAYLKKAGSARKRLPVLQFIHALDPLDEGVNRDLITCYEEDGQTANALATYQSLWNLLDEEYGEEPSRKTQNLIVMIKQRSFEPTDANHRPKIVLQDTRVDHLDTDNQKVAVATRDRLKASLARFREWQIIDRTMIYDDAMYKIVKGPQAYSLELSANSASDGVECQTVLSHLQTGELLWSETFTDPYISIQGNQPDIVRRFAVALNVHLSTLRLETPKNGLTHRDQYNRWLEAQNLILQFKPDGWRKAEKLLDTLIEDHPNFSRGYSSRASIENMRHISFPGLYSSAQLHEKALRLATRSIELDPMDSRGQLAMGWSSAMSRQFEKAELAFDLAFQYNENDPWTISSSAVGLAFCDHTDAANKLVELMHSIGFVLQPSHWSYIAATKFLSGDFRGCITASEKAEEISHDVPAWHAAALAHEGDLEHARAVAQQFMKTVRKNWVAASPASPGEVTRWLVNGFPIRNRESWLALRDGLRLAGLEVPELVRTSP